MNPMLILAASLIAAFVTWYGCGVMSNDAARAISRALFIALFCSPVLVVGHGFAVVPSLFGLALQPSIFSVGPVLIVWVVAICVILSIRALRNHRSRFPPSLNQVFLEAPRTKLLFFGVVAAVLMVAALYADDSRSTLIVSAQYGLFFLGFTGNLALCFRIRRAQSMNIFVAPIFFALPAVAAAAPIVPLIWYGGGVMGGLIAAGRVQLAKWLSTGLFSFLVGNSLIRIYSASVAPAHVTIQGGVAGNAALAIVFAAIGTGIWFALRRLHSSS